MANKPIRWDTAALKQFGSVIEYIAKDSIQNAERVRFEIIQKIESLSINSDVFPPDKYKIENKGNQYRAFELYRLRISYFVGTDEIRIVRIRHTSRQPKSF